MCTLEDIREKVYIRSNVHKNANQFWCLKMQIETETGKDELMAEKRKKKN